ncbi:MAG: hypothetical protein K2J70_05090, partial [Muribaculaceae bacterium]|nr:hypothetical protein [Muribaculaceae bacterium]
SHPGRQLSRQGGRYAQAVYARAILAAKQGDYTKAAEMLAKAKAAGIDTAGAEKTLARMTAPQVTVFTD